jgi:hypothetical protein
MEGVFVDGGSQDVDEWLDYTPVIDWERDRSIIDGVNEKRILLAE